MNTIEKKPKQFTVPRYDENAALQLVAFTGVTYIAFHFTKVLLLAFGREKQEVLSMMYDNISLSTVELFKAKIWTLLSYGLAHHGFWDWFSNVIWLYCFAAVLQNLIGHRQIIPLFFYGLLTGGFVYFIGLQLPGGYFQLHEGQHIMGAYAGVAAIATTAIIISPRYRMSLSEQFSIPLVWITAIFFTMTIAAYFSSMPGILLLSLGGVLAGALFALLIKKGYEPALWIYKIFDQFQSKVTPKENVAALHKEARKRKEVLQSFYTPTEEITQDMIDDLLDKINDKGYNSLTRDEKELLKKAGN